MGEGVGERCGRFSFHGENTRRATRVRALTPFPSDLGPPLESRNKRLRRELQLKAL